ncbi:dihydroneopterin aldolase [Parasphingopyxis sp.]|uniref:dihydroneopterin aldolase n=1 Tax=Parasphingopyxis sp. TaxID=1920299 RepID=UPI00262F0C2B|nr:dihydroneopterin aldolase [Parasphingopyxis sp.]
MTGHRTGQIADALRLEVRDVEVMILTGIYSEETKLPQPLRISVAADMEAQEHFEPDTPLSRSKNYMDLKHAMTDALPKDRHFTLIEAVADHIADTIFLQDDRVLRVTIEIVKLAISENGEEIGITMTRNRR